MQLTVHGIEVNVTKKNIKTLRLRVKPPKEVLVSAPFRIDDEAIKDFVAENIDFIKNAIAEFEARPKLRQRQYVSGETIYLWGKPYTLEFVYSDTVYRIELHDKTMILSIPKTATTEQRANLIKNSFRLELKKEIANRLPKWEALTGLKCNSWQVRDMKTRWGTCNVVTKKIWFNLQLVSKPYECLDYIILHELSHLVSRNHDETFYRHIEKYMPNWREYKQILKEREHDYETDF